MVVFCSRRLGNIFWDVFEVQRLKFSKCLRHGTIKQIFRTFRKRHWQNSMKILCKLDFFPLFVIWVKSLSCCLKKPFESICNWNLYWKFYWMFLNDLRENVFEDHEGYFFEPRFISTFQFYLLLFILVRFRHFMKTLVWHKVTCLGTYPVVYSNSRTAARYTQIPGTMPATMFPHFMWNIHFDGDFVSTQLWLKNGGFPAKQACWIGVTADLGRGVRHRLSSRIAPSPRYDPP